MLELDHTKRIKATEVLKHPFFDEIRKEREELDALQQPRQVNPEDDQVPMLH